MDIYLCFVDCSNKLSTLEKLLKKLSYEMTLIYENSIWLGAGMYRKING